KPSSRIASAISLTNAALLLKCQYKAEAYTSNLLASFLSVTPSRLDSFNNCNASCTILSLLKLMVLLSFITNAYLYILFKINNFKQIAYFDIISHIIYTEHSSIEQCSVIF